MAKGAYKNLIKHLTILSIIILVIAFIFGSCRSTSYEGMDTVIDGDTDEVRAVSHLKVSGSTTPYSATANQLASTIQAYGPKVIADGINASADQLNTVLQNVDSSKFASLYNTILTKMNPPYNPSSSSSINSNFNIANSFLNALSGSNSTAVVAAGPATTINATPISSSSSGPVSGPMSA